MAQQPVPEPNPFRGPCPSILGKCYQYLKDPDNTRDPDVKYGNACTQTLTTLYGNPSSFDVALSFKIYYPDNEKNMEEWEKLIATLEPNDIEYPYFQQYEFRRSSRLKIRTRSVELTNQIIVQFIRENKAQSVQIPSVIYELIQKYLHEAVLHFRPYWQTNLSQQRPKWLAMDVEPFSSDEEWEARIQEGEEWGRQTGLKMEKDALKQWQSVQANEQ